MPDTKTHKKSRFRVKKPIQSFRDLEVYQRSSRLASEIITKLIPAVESGSKAEKSKTQVCDWVKERLAESCFRIPELIARAHNQRFKSNASLSGLDDSIKECSRAIVYLEEIRDIFCPAVESQALCEDLMKRYILVRGKIFNLYKAWMGFGLKVR